MSDPRRLLVRFATLMLPVLATAAPVSFSSQGVSVASAECQDGTCCPEPKSTCVVGQYQRPDKYYKSAGSCTEILPNTPG